MAAGQPGRQYLGTDPRHSSTWSSQSSRSTAVPPSAATAYASTGRDPAASLPTSLYGASPSAHSASGSARSARPLQYSNPSTSYTTSGSAANSSTASHSGYTTSTSQYDASSRLAASQYYCNQSWPQTAGYGSSASPRMLSTASSTNPSYEHQRRNVSSPTKWQDYDAQNITGQARPQHGTYPGMTGSVGLEPSFERLAFQPGAQAASAHDADPRRTSQGSWQGRRDSATAGGRNPHSRQNSGQQRELAEGFKKHKSKFYDVGRVFHMIEDAPHGADTDERSSTWTYNSYGQRIYTKSRRFVVVQQNMQSCLVVPITTYSSRGVAKAHVKKSDHCMAYSGFTVPEMGPGERPTQGEMPMQAVPIKIDPDQREDKLDPMSRIDFATPRRVEHYATVKNYGKVNPKSLHALVTQFQNVMNPSRPTTRESMPAPTALLSSRSKYSQAYHALVNFGWSRQEAAEFVNVNIRASRSTAEAAAADVSSGESDVET